MKKSEEYKKESTGELEYKNSKVADIEEIIDRDVDNIVSLYTRSEQEAGSQQRLIEKITSRVGRPGFLYTVIAIGSIWIVANLVSSMQKWPHLEITDLDWFHSIISLCSLLISIMILITQRRQEELTEQRRHLDLEVSLLVDRKVSKLVEMVQRLRRDTPDVEDQHDPEAEAMEEKADPDTVLTSLEENLDGTTEQRDKKHIGKT